MGGRQAKPAFLIPSKKPQEGTSDASAASPWRHSAFINTSDFLANLEGTVAMAKTHELLCWITNMNVVQYCQPIPTTQHIFSLEASFLHLLSSSSSSFLHCPLILTPKHHKKIPFPPPRNYDCYSADKNWGEVCRKDDQQERRSAEDIQAHIMPPKKVCV